MTRVWFVIEKRETGFGPSVFVGELRTADDKPVTEHLHGNSTNQVISPVSVGRAFGEVAALLQDRAEKLGLQVDTTTGSDVESST